MLVHKTDDSHFVRRSDNNNLEPRITVRRVNFKTGNQQSELLKWKVGGTMKILIDGIETKASSLSH